MIDKSFNKNKPQTSPDYIRFQQALDSKDDTAFATALQSADVNAQDKEGRTPLMYAIITGQTDKADQLIEAGADIHKQTDMGRTAFMLAAAHCHHGLVDKLAEKGANIRHEDQRGQKAIDILKSKAEQSREQKYYDMITKVAELDAAKMSQHPNAGRSPATSPRR